MTVLRNILKHIKMEKGTFIFIDLETTGLPQFESNKTRITELSMTAVDSAHISLGVFPRVLNKLTLCFNPQKRISFESTEITKLSNDLLEHQPFFNSNAARMISDFMNMHKKPMCLVAHNGFGFDFPVLRAELNRAEYSFDESLLCCDSLEMFRIMHEQDCAIDAWQGAELVNGNPLPERQVDVQKSFSAVLKDNNAAGVQKSLSADTQKSLSADAQRSFNADAQKSSSADTRKSSSAKALQDPLVAQNISSAEEPEKIKALQDDFDEMLFNALVELKTAQKINETTPKSLKNAVNVDEIDATSLYYEPSSSINNNKMSVDPESTSKESVRRKLNVEEVKAKKYKWSGKPSFKLGDVYSRMTGKNPTTAHMAEKDIEMLVECAATLGQRFVTLAGKNCRKFSDVPPMMPGKKIGFF